MRYTKVATISQGHQCKSGSMASSLNKRCGCFSQHFDVDESYFCKVRILIEIYQRGNQSSRIDCHNKLQNYNKRETNGKSCWEGPFECYRSQLATCVCKVASAFGFHEVEHTDHVILSIVHLINCISFFFLNWISFR